jgi:HEAT repeat protein
MASLSPAALKRARNSFFVFNGLNSASFILLSGSFITLYALSLGASNAMVGLLNAFSYGTFFFLPLGKRLVRNRPILKVFGLAWFWRFIAVTPALLAPFLVAQGMYALAFALILLGVALFNILRGVGLIGNNPVLVNLADGGAGATRSDRGAFLVNVSIVASLAGMGTNLVVALVIGTAAPPWAFAAAMGVGIAVGIAGSIVLLKRVPEPEGYRPEKAGGLVRSMREAFKEKPVRAYMETVLLLSLVAGMARTFLPVYAKDVFSQGDDVVMAYSLVASVGSLAMGLLTRLLVDRLGAKPLYVIFTAVTALSLAPLAIAPGPMGFLALPLGAAILLGLVNFLSSFGLAGEENVGQTYFFSLVKPERTLDLGVVYFLVYGLGGTIGSGAGGLVLDALGAVGLGHTAAFRLFFALLLAVLAWVLVRTGALVRLGSVSVRESIGVMLSIRDLRAFNLLARLDRSGDPAEEIELIRVIGGAGGAGASHGASGAAQSDLLGYLSSPRFDVRLEALLAIENLGALGGDVVDALAAEVERQPYTTAYLAARILGKSAAGDEERRSLVAATLRRAAAAEDYMLQGSAMVALARLGDRASAGAIEDTLASSRIPRVRISAAYALELLGSSSSVPVLVSCLRRERDPVFVSDELLLSTAAIVGIMPRFYGLYQSFLENEAAGLSALSDIADAAIGEPGSPARAAFDSALAGIFAEPCEGAPMARLILAPGSDDAGASWPADVVLSEAALDPGPGYRGFRFFIGAYVLLRP